MNNLYISGLKKLDDEQLVLSLKTNKILLNEDVKNKVCMQINKKCSLDKVTMLYSTSKLFNLSSLSKKSLRCMERCFALFADSHNFLELDYAAVSKLLSSDKLHIDSEIQVFTAANIWLSHDIRQRGTFAKNLLLKTRFSFLSQHVLEDLLIRPSCFNNYDECTGIIQKVLKNKKMLKSCSATSTTRYCNQKNFDTALCGDDRTGLVNLFQSLSTTVTNNLKRVKILPQTSYCRKNSRVVCVKGQIYVFGTVNDGDLMQTVEKYSPATKTWEKVADMYDERFRFCACTFMDSVLIMGGYYFTKKCSIKFNTNTREWSEIARMNERRAKASCTVFEGKVVVSGGDSLTNAITNTVESYDHVADEWSFMPNMVERRYKHKSVAIKNKLLMIGGTVARYCEVFDSNSNNFVSIKPRKVSVGPFLFFTSEEFKSGGELVRFNTLKTKILYYDLEAMNSQKQFENLRETLEYFVVRKCRSSDYFFM